MLQRPIIVAGPAHPSRERRPESFGISLREFTTRNLTSRCPQAIHKRRYRNLRNVSFLEELFQLLQHRLRIGGALEHVQRRVVQVVQDLSADPQPFAHPEQQLRL